MIKFSRKDLEALLPHREPMLLLDSAELIIEKGECGTETKRGVAYTHIKGDEFFIQGHFPNFPVVPGVILVEMMAQATCVFFADSAANNKEQDAIKQDVITVLTKLDNVKFRNPVKPGDTLKLEVELVKSSSLQISAKGTASVDGKLSASAEFSFVIGKR